MLLQKSIFAVAQTQSKGRLYAEKSREDVRGCFARDRDRILHSTGFRRLKGKTQVFMSTDIDHFRTRLTHTIEVSQIARAIARTFNVDEDLTEAIALSHDLGHTPYGHVGEDALDDCMRVYGGFDHNGQSLRIVSTLEERYPAFDGLNLTWECLEGILKHNGPVVGLVPATIEKFMIDSQAINPDFDLQLDSYASFEAQIAAISDDVAYNHHDLDDGFRAGLFSIEDLRSVEHINVYIDSVSIDYPNITDSRLLAEVVRRMLSAMVMDIVQTTTENLEILNPKSAQDIRNAGVQTVKMSDDMYTKTKALRTFLFERVYRSDDIMNKRDECYEKISVLFSYFIRNLSLLPKGQDLTITDTENTARMVSDYIAGMTDQYADTMYNTITKTIEKT